MIRAVVRSLFVVCALSGVGLAGTPSSAPAPAAHVAKKAHHSKKVKAKKARKAAPHHHKAKSKLK
jgi:hypothetical protein